MRYKLLLFSIVISLSSCINQRIIHGSYSERSVGHDLVLDLNPDSTFLFLCKGCMSWDSISGSWSVSKNKVILNSFLTFQETKSFLENRICDTCEEGITIKVIDHESKADIQYASISTFKQGNIISKVTTNENGNATVKNQQIDSIRVDYIGYKSFTFMPKEYSYKLFVINMKIKELNRYIITNEVWKIKNNQLVSPKGIILKKQ